jgi:hypothetical protein
VADVTEDDSSRLRDVLPPSCAEAGVVNNASEPGRCEFRIRGRLGRSLLVAFPYLHAEANGRDTVLAGPLPDEAALYGVLAQIEALGLELLEFRRVGRDEVRYRRPTRKHSKRPSPRS